MLKIRSFDKEHILDPTIFPDKTSQVWKLPSWVWDTKTLRIDWFFEQEAELVWLLSLRRLLGEHRIELFIPYLPYARQDKSIYNDCTFNLHVFGEIINSMKFEQVVAIDPHNYEETKRIINNFKMKLNCTSTIFKDIIAKSMPDVLVFPDNGAHKKYIHLKDLVKRTAWCEKRRNQTTGEITGMDLHGEVYNGDKILIRDDICDGGATFIGVAKELKKKMAGPITLFVSHGIFSKGTHHLLNNGIDKIITTNSLLRNTPVTSDSSTYEVYPI